MFFMRDRLLMNSALGGGDEGVGSTGGAGAGAGNPEVGATGVPLNTPTEIPQWANGLQLEDPSILNEAMFKTITNVSDVVKGYYHAQKMVGADKLVVPHKNAGEDEWKNFYKKANNIPESIEEYKVEYPATIEDAAFKANLTKKAHEMNIRPDQLAAIINEMEGYNDNIVKNFEQEENDKAKEVITEFSKKWGKDFKANMTVAQRAIDHFGGEGMLEKVLQTPLANDPMFIDLMYSIGKGMYKEDTFTREVLSTFGMTAAESQAEINKIVGDVNGPYYNNSHAQHKDMVKKVNDLFKNVK